MMGKNKEEATGYRHIANYDGDMIYIFISEESREIFISSVKVDKNPKAGAMYGAMCDALTRLVSMAWQHEEKSAVVEQLERASRSEKDLPGILAKIMAVPA